WPVVSGPPAIVQASFVTREPLDELPGLGPAIAGGLDLAARERRERRASRRVAPEPDQEDRAIVASLDGEPPVRLGREVGVPRGERRRGVATVKVQLVGAAVQLLDRRGPRGRRGRRGRRER